MRPEGTGSKGLEIGSKNYIMPFAKVVTFNFCYFECGCFENLKMAVSPNRHGYDLWSVISSHINTTFAFSLIAIRGYIEEVHGL